MPSLNAARSVTASFTPSYVPVAIFVGGTSGIGQGMAESFARYTKGNAHIIIVGRNRKAAESSITSFPKPTSAEAVHEFVECDATLMKNVDAVTKDLLARLGKINFLVLSPGYLSTSGREETKEGIDKRLALNYYARWKFIRDLCPLLKKAKASGEDAKVMSVMAAGKGAQIDLNDLGLKKNYSFLNVVQSVPTYNDLMFESFSTQEPSITFIHSYPGVVKTPILYIRSNSIFFRALSFLIGILASLFAVSPEECAEYMWCAVFVSDQGFHRTTGKGDDLGKKGYFGSDEARTKLWDHTVAAVKV